MKKLVLAMSVSFMMINCTSSDSVESSSNQQARVAAPNAVDTFVWNGGNCYCDGAPTDCLEEVVVVLSQGRMTVDKFKKEIVSSSLLTLINKGEVKIETRYVATQNKEYYILKNSKDNSVNTVYPFKYN